MTTTASKPAINLRSKLTAPALIQPTPEQKFYFDSLLDNGTFDTGIVGWTDFSTPPGNISWNAGRLSINDVGGSDGIARQAVTVETVKVYKLFVERVLDTGNCFLDILSSSLVTNPVVSGSNEFLFTADSSTVTVQIKNTSADTSALVDNIAIFETDGTDVIHTMPPGWYPKDVYENGLLLREGEAHDYTVHTDGFKTWIKPSVTPTALTETCIVGARL